MSLFIAGVTASTVAELVSVNQNIAAYYFPSLQLLIYQKNLHLEIFDREVEADESYFGGWHKGKRGSGTAEKVAVFWLLKQIGKVCIFTHRTEYKNSNFVSHYL